MQLHPTNVVENSLWVLDLLRSKFIIKLVLWKVDELSVVRQFFDVIIHWRNVATQQLINTAVGLVLDLQNITDASIRIFVFFNNLDDLDGTLPHHPVNRQ